MKTGGSGALTWHVRLRTFLIPFQRKSYRTHKPKRHSLLRRPWHSTASFFLYFEKKERKEKRRRSESVNHRFITNFNTNAYFGIGRRLYRLVETCCYTCELVRLAQVCINNYFTQVRDQWTDQKTATKNGVFFGRVCKGRAQPLLLDYI